MKTCTEWRLRLRGKLGLDECVQLLPEPDSESAALPPGTLTASVPALLAASGHVPPASGAAVGSETRPAAEIR